MTALDIITSRLGDERLAQDVLAELGANGFQVFDISVTGDGRARTLEAHLDAAARILGMSDVPAGPAWHVVYEENAKGREDR